MREYTKLLLVAIFASAITFGATQLFQPTPVQAAPPGDLLPADFKIGKPIKVETGTSTGKIWVTYGEWIKISDDAEQKRWINIHRPDVYYVVE